METTCSLETQELLIKIFAHTNPLYAIEQIAENPDLSILLKEFLFPKSHRLTLHGNLERIQNASSRIGISHPLHIEPVLHVFPVYQDILDECFMVPVQISPSDDWQISDAFGTFQKQSGKKTRLETFEDFLKHIEKIWDTEISKGILPLPLRWRKSFALSMKSALNYDFLDGESLQVPLAIAVLRAFSETLSTLKSDSRLPFGKQPVFSTGILDLATGVFGKVGEVAKKLAAFVREYGEGLPAILTEQQINEDLKGNPLLDQVKIKQVNNLAELMRLPELHPALCELCEPPLPTEIDRLMTLLLQMKRGIRFGDMKKIIDWLKPHIHSPVYAFQLERNLGQTFSHRGQFPEAKACLDIAGGIIDSDPSCFGISDIIDLTTAWCTMAVDACAPDMAECWLKRADAKLDQARASDRVKFWGTRCQLYRMKGEYDLAVEAGLNSVKYADMALAGEAGIDRNYLVHALISRARNNPKTRHIDLAEAEKFLRESQNQWAPIEKREVHLGYCDHFEAELARLQGRCFSPEAKPPWSGHWGHPRLFVLLSSARNERNKRNSRMEYAEAMIQFSGDLANKIKDSLFELFHYILLIYFNSMRKEPVDKQLDQVAVWCDLICKKGFPGWQNHLMPFINKIHANPGQMTEVDALCDNFYYF